MPYSNKRKGEGISNRSWICMYGRHMFQVRSWRSRGRTTHDKKHWGMWMQCNVAITPMKWRHAPSAVRKALKVPKAMSFLFDCSANESGGKCSRREIKANWRCVLIKCIQAHTHRDWWAALSVSVWWVISRAKARMECIITSGMVAEYITWLEEISVYHKLL